MIIVTGMRVFKRPWKAALPAVILAEGGNPECGLGLDSRGGHENDGGEGGADEGGPSGSRGGASPPASL